MIEKLITVLQRAHIEPTSEELADVLWLSSRVGPLAGLIAVERPRASAPGETPQPGKPPRPQQEQAAPQPTPSTRGSDTAQDSPSAGMHQAGAGSPAATSKRGISVWSPSASALPGALELGRALRPLKRRVPSKTQLMLDEEET